MHLSKTEIESAFVAKLNRLVEEFSGKTLRRLDFGVFPWHGTIEISVLLVDDQCSSSDIASWPHYDASHMSEGQWPEVDILCQHMAKIWQLDSRSSEQMFRLIGEAVKSPAVSSTIGNFSRSDSFEVTLFNPDRKGSINYCA